MDPRYRSLFDGLEMTLLRAPFAPGLVVAFGRWRGEQVAVSPLATGKGPGRAEAETGCLGEMAENLSIGIAAHPAPVAVMPFGGGAPVAAEARALDLAQADDLGSEGCAAHPEPDGARLAALLERMERAALALWWTGRIPARPLAPGSHEALLRQGNPAGRRTRLWRLDHVPGIIACLATGDDGAGGRAAFGTAAALSPARAARAALNELMLAEIAFAASPAHPDRIRTERLGSGLARRLPEKGEPAAGPVPPEPEEPPAAALTRALAHLDRAGIGGGFADLTHPRLGIPVFRCLCPGLPSARRLGL